MQELPWYFTPDVNVWWFCALCGKNFHPTPARYGWDAGKPALMYRTREYCSYDCYRRKHAKEDDTINGKAKWREQWR